MKTLFISLVLFSFTSTALAQSDDAQRAPAQIKQDRQTNERAKAKYYKGGAEEGELRVQAQLPKAQRKISPVVEKAEAQDHD